MSPKLFFVLLSLLAFNTNGFNKLSNVGITEKVSGLRMAKEPVEVTVNMPGRSGMIASLKIQPILPGPSKMVEIRYGLPFGLDVAPKNNLAVCTKDGPGGEKVDDVLRFASQWTLGLPRGDGLVTTAASFAGGLQWQCSMFDVLRAKSWDQVVEALTSNVPDRTDEVVLIFERPLDEKDS